MNTKTHDKQLQNSFGYLTLNELNRIRCIYHPTVVEVDSPVKLYINGAVAEIKQITAKSKNFRVLMVNKDQFKVFSDDAGFVGFCMMRDLAKENIGDVHEYIRCDGYAMCNGLLVCSVAEG